MSLRPDDRSSRNRDRSSTRDRARSRSNVRKESPPSVVGRGMPGSFSEASYEIRTPDTARYSGYTNPGAVPYPQDDYDQPVYRRTESYEREEYGRGGRDDRRRQDDSDDEMAYRDRRNPPRQYSETTRQETDDYKYSLGRADSYSKTDSYKTTAFAPEGIKYAQTPGLTYTSKSVANERSDPRQQSSYDDDRRYAGVNYTDDRHQSSVSYSDDRRQSNVNYMDDRRQSSYDKNSRIVDVIPGPLRKNSDYRVTRSNSNSLLSSLEPRMDRLSVSGNRPDILAIGGSGLPPPSPMLEAYHGTYQSISPMPMALRLDDDDIDDLPSLVSSHSTTEKKRVKLYDPEADARALAKALSSSSPNSEVICDILPPLSDDQVWELRKEYKKQVKISGKGINLSKHLKMKLPGNFGKVVYVTALGRWESEGYWANFFYQSHGSRRELLVESLMGRTNADIRSIKDEFKDKRYNDDLVRCMEKELKPDKFRIAILMALEGRRQEEQDIYPQEYRDRDVDMLRRAMQSKGGESAMLEIVVRRSDAHLRQILRQYNDQYNENFARVALQKSNNLVGEVVAHILNGVINKPARDALLIRHAIKDIASRNKDDELRYELLISRLVRLHWDRLHLMRVKKEYKDKYGKYLEEDIENSTKGDFKDFVCELCNVQGPGK